MFAEEEPLDPHLDVAELKDEFDALYGSLVPFLQIFGAHVFLVQVF